MRRIISVVLTGMLGLGAVGINISNAAEAVTFKVLSSGVICDSLEFAIEQLDLNFSPDTDHSYAKTCGELAVPPLVLKRFGGLPAKIKYLGLYQTSKTHRGITTHLEAKMVEIDFSISPLGKTLGIQYGYMEFNMISEKMIPRQGI